MKRGANTFPLHNLLPYSESNEGLFLFFSPSLNWIKEKSVVTLAIRTFAIQKTTKSVHRITHPNRTSSQCNTNMYAYCHTQKISLLLSQDNSQLHTQGF